MTSSQTLTLQLPTTVEACTRVAKDLYPEGPFLLRTMAHYRPYICPFDVMIDLVPKESEVLDIGCGVGLFLGLLDSAGLVRTGIGIDVSGPAIALGNRLPGALAGRLSFRRIDATDPPPAGPFDVVSMIDVAHHIPPTHQRGALEAAFDRVRPGGLFLYKDIGRRPVVHSLANRLHDLVIAREWIHYVGIDDVARWITAKGADCIAGSEFSRLWYPHELRCFRKTAE